MLCQRVAFAVADRSRTVTNGRHKNSSARLRARRSASSLIVAVQRGVLRLDADFLEDYVRDHGTHTQADGVPSPVTIYLV
jgi:hypothetical protein